MVFFHFWGGVLMKGNLFLNHQKKLYMAANSIGKIFVLTTFGESHGKAIGGVIDGCPSKLHVDMSLIEAELLRRATGHNGNASQRKESDKVQFLSGIHDGYTLGTPIAFMVCNEDARPQDYDSLKDVYRPSHADYSYHAKYGIRDWRGGGRASARTTLPIVVAGAIAKQILAQHDIAIQSSFSISGNIEEAKRAGDTLGGYVKGCITNVPAGLGEPMFDKFQADLAKAMFCIPAVKGFEYGDGFAMAEMKGSECNDSFVFEEGRIRTLTKHSGGIQGGITNGEAICFRVAFKPIPSIGRAQQTVNVQGNPVTICIEGRHDVSAVPRAAIIVEALAAMTTLDHLLRFKAYQ